MKKLIILRKVSDFIEKMPDTDSGKLLAHLKFLELDKPEVLLIKTLRKKIKEIIIAQYRIIFFVIHDTIYVVDAFRKKSQKTPISVIRQAEKIYKELREQ